MNLFIHHRDLRNQDNTTLNKMLDQFKGNVQPIFIFTPEQIDPKKNPYFSNYLVEFMCKSLLELHKSYGMSLSFFHGDPIKVLSDLHDRYQIQSVGWNMDYSPYAKKRDQSIKSWCKKHKVRHFEEEDMLLVPIRGGHNKTGSSEKPYQKFTPFKNHIRSFIQKTETTSEYNVLENKSLKGKYAISPTQIKKFYTKSKNAHVSPGRKNGLKILSDLQLIPDYAETRNTLSKRTSNLSAFINLGCISIREMLNKGESVFGSNSSWESELIWRDFYYNILYYFPHVVGNSFKKKYDAIEWKRDKEGFKRWRQGKTGFPIVDACMRQLNTTGYMHNRGRMIVASFLTKDLGINWREGERYFAKSLIDYNISANNGGWQWSSGTGTDSQPYFRIFNPWSQNKSFDEDCVYVKRWVPELRSVPVKHILEWNTYHTEYPEIKYPAPMLDHSEARKSTLDMYKKNL